MGAFAVTLHEPKPGPGNMNREEAIERLRRRQGELMRAGVTHLYMFGSTARGEAGADSDVDLFFDYDRRDFGLFALIAVKDMASEILKRPADVISRDSLHPLLRARIEASAVQVF